jgi:GntR family transcriptional regulator
MNTTPTTASAPDLRLPRYLQIRDELMRRIGARTWTIGQAMPSEDKLAAEFSVSLGTMRQALQMLVAAGVIERIHGRGTFVTRAFEHTSMMRFVRFRGASESELPDARVLSLDVCNGTEEVRGKLGLATDEKLLRIHRTRSYGDEVILVEHIWVSHQRFIKLEAYLRTTSPPLLYPIYDSLCGILVSRAIDDLSVAPFLDEDAAIFKVPPHTLGVRIERQTLDQAGEPVEWRVSQVTTDRFHYTVEIR